jgi:hypothetical protein
MASWYGLVHGFRRQAWAVKAGSLACTDAFSCHSRMNGFAADDVCTNVPVVSRQGQTDIPAAIDEFYE